VRCGERAGPRITARKPSPRLDRSRSNCFSSAAVINWPPTFSAMAAPMRLRSSADTRLSSWLRRVVTLQAKLGVAARLRVREDTTSLAVWEPHPAQNGQNPRPGASIIGLAGGGGTQPARTHLDGERNPYAAANFCPPISRAP
jgi:hypothetical protein